MNWSQLLYRTCAHACKILLVSFVLGCAVGCGPRDPQDPSYLYLHLTANPTTLDPAFIVDVSGAEVAAKLFNGLVAYDRRNECTARSCRTMDYLGRWKDVYVLSAAGSAVW